jgi:hypothetical protein
MFKISLKHLSWNSCSKDNLNEFLKKNSTLNNEIYSH